MTSAMMMQWKAVRDGGVDADVKVDGAVGDAPESRCHRRGGGEKSTPPATRRGEGEETAGGRVDGRVWQGGVAGVLGKREIVADVRRAVGKGGARPNKVKGAEAESIEWLRNDTTARWDISLTSLNWKSWKHGVDRAHRQHKIESHEGNRTIQFDWNFEVVGSNVTQTMSFTVKPFSKYTADLEAEGNQDA
ncbi:hypothetical protein B0H14DRAFT_3164643 [Mycena olivaceomarginata]|nr:hypothetical protein B0H14DRAFT_3164643 [Mycena olivaceomarginata]